MAGQPIDMTDYLSSKSDHLTTEDFIGGPRIFTIREVGATGDDDRPIYILFTDEPRAFLPSKTCRRVLSRIWPEASKRAGSEYLGRSLRLYLDPDVTFGKDTVGGIRIDGASHLDRTVTGQLPAGRNKRAPFRVEPLRAETRQAQQPTTEERIAKAEAMLTNLAPLRLQALKDQGNMTQPEYLRALQNLYRAVSSQGEE
jgi:hypothetical protein